MDASGLGEVTGGELSLSDELAIIGGLKDSEEVGGGGTGDELGGDSLEDELGDVERSESTFGDSGSSLGT